MRSFEKKNLACEAEILKYRLAVYNKKAKEKFVYFYVLDPESLLTGCPKLKRIRKKFNLDKSARANDEEAMRYVAEVNRKLASGWNPLMESNCKKSFTFTDEVLDQYEKYLMKLLKDEVFTEKTYTDYCSRLKIQREYIAAHPIPYIYV